MQTIIIEAAVATDAEGNVVDAIPTLWLDVAPNFICEHRILALPPASGMPPMILDFCYN